jgi:hypothetical protein
VKKMAGFSTWSLKNRFHREIDQQIESYSLKLGSGELIDLKEAAECHAMKLVLEKGSEKRLRSIQTLAQLRNPLGIGPAVKDLLLVCKRWPENADHSWLLACALKDLLGADESVNSP